ncbi:MAG: Crp/Fnr family transcriptional regulator, partial [Lachnospiraceae bacterium]
MYYSILQNSSLFKGLGEDEISDILGIISPTVKYYDKGNTVFNFMDTANRIGIILEGRVEARKNFPNGRQVDVSVRNPGDIIGPAAVFSKSRKYPCDIVAIEPAKIMLLHRDELLKLMQLNLCILQNFTTEISTATYMLQQRLELLSYGGIAQKAAFWLLMQSCQSGKDTVTIPDSISKWAMLMNVSRT